MRRSVAAWPISAAISGVSQKACNGHARSRIDLRASVARARWLVGFGCAHGSVPSGRRYGCSGVASPVPGSLPSRTSRRWRAPRMCESAGRVGRRGRRGRAGRRPGRRASAGWRSRNSSRACFSSRRSNSPKRDRRPLAAAASGIGRRRGVGEAGSARPATDWPPDRSRPAHSRARRPPREPGVVPAGRRGLPPRRGRPAAGLLLMSPEPLARYWPANARTCARVLGSSSPPLVSAMTSRFTRPRVSSIGMESAHIPWLDGAGDDQRAGAADKRPGAAVSASRSMTRHFRDAAVTSRRRSKAATCGLSVQSVDEADAAVETPAAWGLSAVE